MTSGTFRRAQVALLIALLLTTVLFGYLVVRWNDPTACPGLMALDPTCVAIRD